MKEAADAEKFKAFADAHRKRLEDKMLGRVRRQSGDPNWVPNGVLSGGGLWFGAQVDRQLRMLYRRTTRIRVAGTCKLPGDRGCDARSYLMATCKAKEPHT